MYRVYSILLASVCIASLAYRLNGAELPSSSQTTQLQIVVDKLESYAVGLTKSSWLTMDEMMSAYKEFARMNPETRKMLREQNPLIHLLCDFLLFPMSRFKDLIGDGPEAAPFYEDYITRLEKSYKKFRAGYLGGTVGEYRVASKKMDLLIEALMGVKDRAPVTMKMIEDAKREYDALLAKWNEIGQYEDIYSCLKEVEEIIDTVYRASARALNKIVFAALPGIDNIELITMKFRNEMYLAGFLVQNGKLYSRGAHWKPDMRQLPFPSVYTA